MILSYTDCKKMSDVLVISLRAKGLVTAVAELSKCVNLRVAFLSFNKLGSFADMNHLQRLTNLVKLNLSNNNIVLLPAYHTIQSLRNLRILFLDHN